MSSKHKEKNISRERMDGSSNPLPEKIEPTQNGSFTMDSSVPKSDSSSVVTVVCQKERRRKDHNDMEKKRKEQIKACICKMGELLPQSYVTGERQSTLEIVEKSLNYMREMKEARSKFTATEDSLNQELTSLKLERDKLLDIIKAAGLSSESLPTNGVSSTTDVKDDSPKPKPKAKKKNLSNSQVQQRDKDKVSQEIISSSVSVSEDSGNNNFSANPMMNMPNGESFVNGQNVMFNPMMMQGANQFMMPGPGMMGAGNQMMGPMGMMTPGGQTGANFQGVPNMPLPNDAINAVGNTKPMDDTDAAGLLQLAMQDAGITPNSGASQPGSSAVTPSITDTTTVSESSDTTQTNALQTLASVATSNQGVSPVTNITENQSVSNTVTGSNSTTMSTSVPVMTTQSGFNTMLQNNNNNAFINMPVMGNQPMLQGQQQQQTQQLMFFNEQGIPMIANVPVGPDPNNQTMFSNLQKQGLVPGLNQQTLVKDQSGNIEQNSMNNALALAQQQANMAAIQGQLLGQGAGLQNMAAFQQGGLLNGNIIQTQNGQFIQQITPQAQMPAQLQGQGQIIGMPGQGQSIMVGGQQNSLPVSQNQNFLALNTAPTQPNQLPSALILPNGQIIPVVTNPSTVVTQSSATFNPTAQLPQTRLSAPQIQGQIPPALDGQLVPGTQGLLMPAVTGAPAVSTSVGATLTTSVVPTSAIHSVMTTQIQGSSFQSQKIAASAAQVTGTDVSNAIPSQPKMVSLPPGAVTSTGQVATGLVQPGGKSAAPILISLPINGQPTTVLLDPVTMQVLGTVNPQQQAPNTVASTATTVAAPVTSVATQPANPAPTVSTASKNKNKNNANQRAICPKPSGGADGSKVASTPSKKKKSSKSSNKTKETVPADSLSDSLQIQIPESTTDPEVTSAISSESTDILAKAAESIFSSPLGEMGTVGGFYNPANEDNPLHIDTSVTENEEENKSPNKGDRSNSETIVSGHNRTLEDNVIGINSVAEGAKSFNVPPNPSKAANRGSTTVSGANKVVETSSDNVTSLSATLEEIVGIGFQDSPNVPMEVSEDVNNSDIMEISVESKNKKSKANNNSAKTSDNVKEMNTKQSKKVTGTKNVTTAVKNSSQKKSVVEKSAATVEPEKTDSDSQMDIESTLIHIPEEITFSEKDLSEVLDQVEQLGNSSVQSPQRGQTSKKSKVKRTKTSEAENEPASKKRKGGKEIRDSKPVKSVKEVPLSMPSSFSVYDFDGSDDIVPSILPLNAKDFTSLSSTTQSMPTKSELGLTDSNSNDSRSNSGNKSTKSSAQTKPPQTSTSQKTNKSAPSAKSGTEPSSTKLVEEVSNAPLFNFPDNLEKSTPKEITKEKLDTCTSKPTESTSTADNLQNMPEIDTTTSLFGFPVPKKMHRPDITSKPSPQMSPKPSTQVSPKPPAQTNVVASVPKPNTVSPKPSMTPPRPAIVSPKQSVMSPDMVSPKLNIVSPNPSLLSDPETAPSPKHTPEMSPIKKRTSSDRLENMKISTFSALNTVVQGAGPASESCVPMNVNKENLVSNVNTTKSAGVITSSKSALAPVGQRSEPCEPQKSKETSSTAKPLSEPPCNVRMDSQDIVSSNNIVKPPQAAPMPSNKTSMSSRSNYNTPAVDSDTNLSGSNYKNNMNMQRPHPPVNTSQNNKYGPSPPKYGTDPMYGNMMGMNNKPMAKDPMPSGPPPGPMSSMNTFPASYSSESIFSNQDKVIKSPPNVNIQNNPNMLSQDKQQSSNMKVRNNNYSVDNFVQSSREEAMRLRNEVVPTQSDLMDASDLGNPSNDFSRLQSASSPDGFNFANIGLNLPPITTTAPSSNFMDLTLPNSSSVITSNSSSFSFSLSSTSSTVTTTSSGGLLGQHQFPFYPVPSASSSASSTEPGMSNMGMFGQNNNVIQRNNTVMHPSGSNSNMQRADNSHMSRMDTNISRVDNQHGMQRGEGGQSVMPEDVSRDQINTSKSSCSKQTKMSKVPAQPSIQDSCSYPNPGRDQNFYPDSQMKSNVGKSAPDQMRKPPDMNPAQSHSSNQPTHQEKRANIDRSPQMMNNAPQSYFSPNYPPAKPLNTPPLHHPSLMPPDDRSRNMTNRSPYDNPYHPPSSQGFNPMSHSYPPNRFEGSNYNRDNSGTQPLSHTPVNSGGRKSANPQQSVVKPPPKQSAPPLVPMAPQQPQSQGPRPTPPQSHRANTPINNPPPPAPTPTQVNQSRHSKQPSRSKPPSKKNKSMPPFVEVDSNLSNSIFETNRSMTPFFPMQNLSPQSRAMQHEGSPFPFFGPGPRFPNSNTPMPKNSDIGAPFNPLFPPRGAQNGLGLNFQPGFGMNMNPLHGNHGNGPQITPHTAPHMTNFNLNNIFSDVNSASQNESSLNISPIKFPHTNFQHQGMDHNAIQHHHQYNRGHHSVMSINSILGPNHHGFDGRMNTSMAGFHSHAHPSFIPTLNFSMHDH